MQIPSLIDVAQVRGRKVISNSGVYVNCDVTCSCVCYTKHGHKMTISFSLVFACVHHSFRMVPYGYLPRLTAKACISVCVRVVVDQA